MKVFRQEVQVAATAYVRAENEEEAKRLIEEAMSGAVLRLPIYPNLVPREYFGAVLVSGEAFPDMQAGVASLSPAMTVVGPIGDIELAE